eukprot:6421031-Prymnesium_polylepis.1
MESQEGDAHKKSHQHSCLLILFFDQQNPSADRELAAHLERLPPEGLCRVVGPQEGCRTAEGIRNVRSDRTTSRPQQHHVQQRDPYRPHDDHDNRRGASRIVLGRVATQSRVRVQIAAHHAVAGVLE